MLVVLVGVLVVAAIAAFVVMAFRRDWRWTGLPADPGDGTRPPRPAKTLWDLLQLLIVPLMLAAAAFALNSAQTNRDRKQAERSAARERASAADLAREETLRTYLQQMSGLMTTGGRATADTQTLAQTLTLVALRRLDGVRKGLVVQFLIEADLIEKESLIDAAKPPGGADAPRPVRSCGGPGQASCRRIGVSVSLAGADLQGAVIPSLGTASQAAFGVSASGRPVEPGPSFDFADLRNADFHRLTLPLVTFFGADLRGANFSDARLVWTSFSSACLSGARFDGAEVAGFADFSATDGLGVDFSNAQLAKATFADARLTDVQLSGAKTARVRWPRGWTEPGSG